MPTTSDILALALRAMGDADARAVMADAIEETGWWDERCDDLTSLAGVAPRKYGSFPNVYLPVDIKSIAAVLLFGEWGTEMWPVVAKCKVWITAVDGYLVVDGQRIRLRDLRMGPVHVNVRRT